MWPSLAGSLYTPCLQDCTWLGDTRRSCSCSLQLPGAKENGAEWSESLFLFQDANVTAVLQQTRPVLH
jgi:hypothetical protein